MNICLTPSINNLLNQIKSIVVADLLILCTATLKTDNLYAVESILQRDLLPGEELIMDIKIIAEKTNNV